MFERVKEFSGHSGCRLFLYMSGSSYFVRKMSGHESYNQRLKKQLIKQKHFCLPMVKTPRIFGYGEEGGLFYFDMEYVQGVTLANAMRRIQVNEIEHLVELLLQSIPISQARYHVNTDAIFRRKILRISRNIGVNWEIARESLAILDGYDFSKVPLSFCCGDLTLENIILSPSGQIYLIDLLDSFFNSWMMDVAKLLQDLELGWSYRHERRNFNINLRLDTAKAILLSRLLAFSNGGEYIENIYMLLLLNVLRIIPYIKDEGTRQFVDGALLNVIRKIHELKEEL